MRTGEHLENITIHISSEKKKIVNKVNIICKNCTYIKTIMEHKVKQPC